VEAVPLHLKEAYQFVARYHRYSLPTENGGELQPVVVSG
jgi:hypothetical protein